MNTYNSQVAAHTNIFLVQIIQNNKNKIKKARNAL